MAKRKIGPSKATVDIHRVTVDLRLENLEQRIEALERAMKQFSYEAHEAHLHTMRIGGSD